MFSVTLGSVATGVSGVLGTSEVVGTSLTVGSCGATGVLSTVIGAEPCVTSVGTLAFNINQTTDPEQMYIYMENFKIKQKNQYYFFENPHVSLQDII